MGHWPESYWFGQLTYSRFCTSPYSNSLFIKFLNDYLEREKKKKKKNDRATAGTTKKVLIRAINYYKGQTCTKSVPRERGP